MIELKKGPSLERQEEPATPQRSRLEGSVFCCKDSLPPEARCRCEDCKNFEAQAFATKHKGKYLWLNGSKLMVYGYSNGFVTLVASNGDVVKELAKCVLDMNSAKSDVDSLSELKDMLEKTTGPK